MQNGCWCPTRSIVNEFVCQLVLLFLADCKKIFLLSEEKNRYIYYFLPSASKHFYRRLYSFQHQWVRKTWGSLKKCWQRSNLFSHFFALSLHMKTQTVDESRNYFNSSVGMQGWVLSPCHQRLQKIHLLLVGATTCGTPPRDVLLHHGWHPGAM